VTFRFWDNQAYVGYGVSTRQVSETNADIQYSIADILLNADFPSLGSSVTNLSDLNTLVITVQWRVKIIIDIFDESIIKMYNARMGKRQFGEYITGAYNYFSGNGFVSFETFISPLMNASMIASYPSYEQPDLPCDEPPNDLPLPPLTERSMYPYTQQITSTFASGGYTIAGNPDSNIADSFFCYLTSGVAEYTSAVTYIVSCIPFTDEDMQDSSPIILLL